ncbi:MAG: sulfatase [Pseudomonadota bacterium]|nr:sulfatase [Pseudomonadota bacterium]
MNELPTRRLTGLAIIGAAAGAGALFGSAEGARVVIGQRLLLGDIEVVALLLLGALGGAALSAAGSLPLVALQTWGLAPRPLGRARWLGFVWGMWVPIVGSAGVAWFTDPPPFTEPFPFQGNPAVFAALVVAIGALFGVVYQGARGARAVSGAALSLAVGVAAWVYAAVDPPPAPSKPLPAGAPNVLLVTLDTTRADRMGAYGNEHMQTRAFDALAAQGALFTAASAVAPVTGPSHASMLSGRGPWDHGVLLNGVPLPEAPLLAELLHERGYATGAFVSAYVLDGELGFARGFEVYDDDFGWLPGVSALLPARLLAMARRHADPDEVLERRGADTVDQALTWIGQRPGGAWFLWVHLFDAHGPYMPAPPYDTLYYQGDARDPANTSMGPVQNIAPYLKKSLAGVTDLKYVLAQYDGEVSYADAQLARLLAAVDTQNTLVAVMGDHGESLGEHGVWFNHGDDVYESSVHVPFALRWPGRVPVTRVTSPVEGTDLTPTLLDLVGIPVPEDMTGQSAVPTMAGGPGRAMASAMCFDRVANLAAREAGTITGPKYRMAGLRGPNSRFVAREVDGTSSYFDLSADPLGVVDVVGPVGASPEGGELLSLLRARATALFTGSDTSRSAVDLADEERERLEALGYMEP